MRLNERLLRSVALTSAIGLPSIFVATGYFGVQWPGQLVFHSDDGWCVPATQGVGVHCFGDYADMQIRRDGAPWARVSGPNAHPPLSIFIQDTFGRIGTFAGSHRIGLALWLLAMALCVLLPIVWATRPLPSQTRAVEILLFGIATTPFLAALDRGNSAPLVLPALLWFGVSMGRGRNTAAMWAIVLASLVRPQMLVLALLFLFRKDLLNLLRTLGLGLLGILLSFALYPGNRIANLTDWIVNMLQYGSYRTPLMPFPQSLGSGRSIVFIGEVVWTRLLGHEPQATRRVFRADTAPLSTVLDFVDHNRASLALASAGIVLALLVTFYMRGHRLTNFTLVVAGCVVPVILPTVSFMYYLVLLLIPVAVLVRDRHGSVAFFESAPRWLERAAQTVFVTAMTVSLVPTAVPLSWLVPVPTYRAANLFMALVGPLWMLWGALILIGLLLPQRAIVKTGWRVRSAPTH